MAMDSNKNQTYPQVQWLTVDSEYIGQRIDNYLMRILKGVPKSYIYRILRRGEVRVNKGRIKPTYRLMDGDQLRIPPVRVSQGNSAVISKKPRWLEERIVYEDKRIIILNKPSGLAVHGGSGVQFGVIEAMRKWRDDLHYLELVHRLDRDTSGCLVLAKKRSALRQLHEQLREGQVQKRYLALVDGNWQYGNKTVTAPLQKQVLRSGERRVKVSEQGKEAATTFRPLVITKKASLLDVELHTGRTHQIRVHSAHMGHPIVGDEKYGNEGYNRFIASTGFKRLFLHARSVSFTLQEPELEVIANAPLDPAFEVLLNKLDIVY